MLRRAPLTVALIASIVLVFLLDAGLRLAGWSDVLFQLGANYGPLVAEGQLWRLLTSMFLHGGILHLAVNAWALYQLGALVEIWMGRGRLALVYMVTGLAGSLASVLWNLYFQDVPHPSVGASGAIFGLLGTLIAFLLRRRDNLRPEAKKLLLNLAFWAGINIFFGLTVELIDNAAHMGGLVAGFALGWFLKPRRLLREPPPPASETLSA